MQIDVAVIIDQLVKDGITERLALECLLVVDAQLLGFVLLGMAQTHCDTTDPSYLGLFEMLLRSQ